MSVGLSGVINNALTGIQSVSTALNVVSDNIANANNENYDRREAVFSDISVGGVTVSSIRRETNSALERLLLKASSDYQFDNVKSTQFTNIEQALGIRLEGVDPLSSIYSDFLSAWRDFEASPEISATQENVIRSGQNLISEITRIEAALADVQSTIERQLEDDITTLNTRLSEIDRLNGRIALLSNGQLDATELEGQRRALVEDVSELVQIHTYTNSQNEVQVVAAGGLALLVGEAVQFRVNARTLNIENTNDFGANVINRFIGGRIAGNLDILRTNFTSVQNTDQSIGTLQKLRNHLDEITFQLADDASVRIIGSTNIINANINETTNLVQASNNVVAGNTLTLNINSSTTPTTFTLVAGTPVAGNNEFSNLAELAALINTVSGATARINTAGRIEVATTEGSLQLGGVIATAFGLSTDLTNPESQASREASVILSDTANVATNIGIDYTSTTLTDSQRTINLQVVDNNGNLFDGVLQIPAAVAGDPAKTQAQFIADLQAGLSTNVTVNGVTTTLANLGITLNLSASNRVQINSTRGNALTVVASDLTRALGLADGDVDFVPPLTFSRSYNTARTRTGELAQSFFTPAQGSLEDVSRLNIQVNTSLTSGTTTLKRDAATPVIRGLDSQNRSINSSGLSVANEDYSGLISSFTLQTTERSRDLATRVTTTQTIREEIYLDFRNRVGVNLDNELARLTVLQNSFAANARALSVSNTLFDQLLQLI